MHIQVSPTSSPCGAVYPQPARHKLCLCYVRPIAAGTNETSLCYVLWESRSSPLFTKKDIQIWVSFFVYIPNRCVLLYAFFYLPQSLTLFLLSYIRFVVFLSQLFDRKVAKTPGTRVEQVTHSSARVIALTTPPYRIPCGANCVCTTHDYMLAVLSICKANSLLLNTMPVWFNITFADGKPRIITVSQTVPVWF